MKRMMTTSLLAVVAASTVACGGASVPAAPLNPAPPTPPPPLGAVDPAMVGTWMGTVDGSFGPGTLTLRLFADARAEFGGSGNYCRATGGWGIASEFKARGSDCTGTVITLSAPPSATHLSGRWVATSGREGTFSVTRQ